MDLLNSLFVSTFGMTVVFLALILLIVMINVMTFAVQRAGRIERRPAAAGETAGGQLPADSVTPALAAQLASVAAAGGASRPALPALEDQGLKLTHVDEKTAAMIMAIVCDDSGIPPEELYFKSIRLLDA